jgi:hypothetical protein
MKNVKSSLVVPIDSSSSESKSANDPNTPFKTPVLSEMLTEKQKLRNEMLENKGKVKEKLKYMSPEDMFALFDEDDSGRISFDEFRKLLPYIDVHISDAKAFRYFRLCDTDGSGEIDIDEFLVAIFICDPVSTAALLKYYLICHYQLVYFYHRRMEIQ